MESQTNLLKKNPPFSEQEFAEEAVTAALDTKAEDLLLYDMDGRSSITDYVLLCSGRSQAHVRGICDQIAHRLKQVYGVSPMSLEGEIEGSWVLLDFDVLLVHIFHPETRQYYDLESILEQYSNRRYAPPTPSDGPDSDAPTSLT